MSTFSLKAIQNMPVHPEKAWNFFSNPANLQAITPAKLQFRIISDHHGETMYPGQIIEYTVRPLLGIPIYWMTEITHVEDNKMFIDEQRIGPYRFWQHQHHFKAVQGGVEMTDIIHYRNPFGFIGNVANTLFVKNQLKQIFEFRFKKIESLFGKWKDANNQSIVIS